MTTMQTLRSAPSSDLPDCRVRDIRTEGPRKAGRGLFLVMDTFNDSNQWNQASAELGTLLGVWAHPDDEAYLTAGLMAVARAAGNRVVVVTRHQR